jgi:hypothetical protein
MRMDYGEYKECMGREKTNSNIIGSHLTLVIIIILYVSGFSTLLKLQKLSYWFLKKKK